MAHGRPRLTSIRVRFRRLRHRLNERRREEGRRGCGDEDLAARPLPFHDQNLVFDENGRIELAVIGVGGFLGIGEKEVAVPFDSVKSDVVNNKHVFTVDATKEQLQAAPAFKTLNDQAFKERLAGWRTKASQSWAEVKARASKAYDDAKTRVNEARQPAEPPKSTPQ